MIRKHIDDLDKDHHLSTLNDPSEETKSSEESANTSFDSEDWFGDNDPIVKEGEIMRFKPGIAKNFVPRYV